MPLDFTRFSVPTTGAQFEEEIKQALEDAEKPGADKQLFKQIGIWFAYYKRDLQNALIYLNKYRRSFKTEEEYISLDYAEATNDLGRAYTMDGSYKDFSLFQEALDIFSARPESKERTRFGTAFALHQIGLMHHRCSENADAQRQFKTARDMYAQLSLETDDERYHIYVAESHHLLGVSYMRENKLKEAQDQLGLAYEIETINEQINGPHYLTFITAQSLADCIRKLAQAQPTEAGALLKLASELLIETYAKQVNYYKQGSNADIAKTLAFLGDNYFASKDWPVAFEFYVAALEMKLAIFKDANHPLVKITLDDLSKLLNECNYKFPRDEDVNNLIEVCKTNNIAFEIPKSFYTKRDLDKFIKENGLTMTDGTLFGLNPVTEEKRADTPRPTRR